MPYMKVKEGNQICVYKKGPDGKPEGSAKGKFDTEEKANAQIAALEIAMKHEKKEGVLSALSNGFKSLVDFFSGDSDELAFDDKAKKPPFMFDEETPKEETAPDEEKDPKKKKDKEPKEEKKEFELGFKVIGDRWIAAWTNNFVDRADQAFNIKSIDEYISSVYAKPEDMPELWAWHKPAPLGKAEMLARVDHIVLASGKFYEDKPYVQAFKENQPKRADKDGMSHGFWYYTSQLKDGVYNQFKTFEITVLPKERAANPFTSFAVKENDEMLTSAQKEYFKELFGDKADAYLAEVEKKSQELEAKGIHFKESDEASQKANKELNDKMDALTKAVTDQGAAREAEVKELKEKVGLIEGFLKFEFQSKDLASKSTETQIDPDANKALKDLKGKNDEQAETGKKEQEVFSTIFPMFKPVEAES